MTAVAARPAPELLSELVSWYAHDPLVGPEYSQAAFEFFGGQAQPWYAPDEGERRQAYGRCGEWFVYDRPSVALGRTPFEHHLAAVGLAGRSADRDAMRRFADHRYGFFEVTKVMAGKRVVVRDTGTGAEHATGDRNTAAWVRTGMRLLARLFPWQDGQILSPAVIAFSGRDRWVERYRAAHPTPDARSVEAELFQKRRNPALVLRSRQEVEADLADFCGAFELKDSPATLFAALGDSARPTDFLGKYLPKVARRPGIALYDLNDLGTLVLALWHHVPQADLRGQTPYELQATDPARYQGEVLPRLNVWAGG